MTQRSASHSCAIAARNGKNVSPPGRVRHVVPVEREARLCAKTSVNGAYKDAAAQLRPGRGM